MNYMLLENQTLSSMKKQVSGYVKTDKEDPVPSEREKCHAKNITCILIIYPEDLADGPVKKVDPEVQAQKSASEIAKETAIKKKYMKFVTGD